MNEEKNPILSTVSSMAIYTAINMSLHLGAKAIGGPASAILKIAGRRGTDTIVGKTAEVLKGVVSKYTKLDTALKGELSNELLSVPSTMIQQKLTMERDERQGAGEVLRDGIIGSLVFRGVTKGAGQLKKNIPKSSGFKTINNTVSPALRQMGSKAITNVMLYNSFVDVGKTTFSSKVRKKPLEYFKAENINEAFSNLDIRIKAMRSVSKIDGYNNRIEYLTKMNQNNLISSSSNVNKKTLIDYIQTGYNIESHKGNTNRVGRLLNRLTNTNVNEDFNYYKGFDTFGSGVGTIFDHTIGKMMPLGGIPLTKILGLDKLTSPNIHTTHLTILNESKSLVTGSKIDQNILDTISSGVSDQNDDYFKAFGKILGLDYTENNKKKIVAFAAANQDMNKLTNGTLVVPAITSWAVTNTGIYDTSDGTQLISLGAFSGIEADQKKFITAGIHDKRSTVATSLIHFNNTNNNIMTQETDELLSLPFIQVDNLFTKILTMDRDHVKNMGELQDFISKNETVNNLFVTSAKNKQASLELAHELLNDKNVKQNMNHFDFANFLVDPEEFGNMSIEDQTKKMNELTTAFTMSGKYGDSKSLREVVGTIPHTKVNNVGSYELSNADVFNAAILREVALQQSTNLTKANGVVDLERVLGQQIEAIKGANYIEKGGSLSNILTNGTQVRYGDDLIELNNPLLVEKLKSSNNTISAFSTISGQGELHEQAYENIINNNEFISITGFVENGSVSGLDFDMNAKEYSNIFTSVKAMNVSMMSSVNTLATQFGLGINFDIHDSPLIYAARLASDNALKIGSIGLGLAAVDMGARIFGEGTALEDGLIPFATAVASDTLLASREIADMTGLSTLMGGINNVIPGLISSPIGGLLLGATPLLAGYKFGMESNNVMTGLTAGAVGSMILGGGISGIFGSYDLSKDSDEYYAEVMGTGDVAIRNARFWALNDSSFLGTNVNYYGDSGFAKNMTNAYSTANIGYTPFGGGNTMSRPYADSETIRQLNQGISLNMSGESTYEVASDILGLRGFAFKSITKSGLNTDMMAGAPVLANPDDAYSVSRQFQNMQLGGGLGQTEFFRRILQDGRNTSSKNIVNPVKNLMPEWMPGSNYMYNFKTGDPYTIISDGEIRLPGTGHLSNNKPKMSLPYDLNLMGFASTEEYVANVAYGGLSSNKVLKSTEAIKEQHIQMIKESTGLDPVINKAYYAGNNTIGNSDYELNGTAYKLEIVDNEQFAIGQETGRFKKRADLLATISEKPAVLIVINGETNQQIEIQGEYDPELLKSEVKKLHSIKDDLFSAMSNTGIGFAHGYSIVDRFLVLADTSPYSNEFKNYRNIVAQMMENNELDRSEVKKVAQALRQTEVVVSGLQTGTEKQFLSQYLPNKFLHPDYIDPLDSYIHTQKLSSGMKQWDNHGEYFEDDFKSALSGDISASKQFIGSMGLYGFLLGPGNAVGAATMMTGLASASNLAGGIHFSDKYDDGRDLLRQQDALNYARGESSFMQSVQNGETNLRTLISKLPKGDKQTAVALSQVTDPQYQKEIYDKINDPHLKYVLAQAYGYGNSGNDILTEGYSYIDGLDDESALFDEGVDTDYFVIKSALEQGINPKQLGKGFDVQEYERRNSAYADMSLTSSTVQSIQHRLTNKLSFLGNNVSIEVVDYSDNQHIDVVIYEQ